MRIACLQFAPQVGDIENNLNRADSVLSKANPQDLDLLVLPELAFSGYNFKSLQHISPYLEPTTSGITSLWARTTALKYECVVTVGYPEKVDITPKWPASPEYYNSAITVSADGETIANYRKSFLYYTDETWALEGPDGFFDGEIDGLGNVAMGICKWPTKSFERMDLNPYKFESPWSAWEFAYHILHKEANLVIMSMAWLTREDARSYSRAPKEPDMETLSYWLARLEPVIRAETEGEIIVVLANRCGTEGEAVYAGTSAVLGIQGGEVKVYGILGRGEKELLIVDTKLRPQAKLISEPSSTVSANDTSKRPLPSSRFNPDSRTNSSASTVSDVSTKTSSTGLSVNTQSIPRSSATPPTPDAMDVTIGDIVTPISPVDPKSPSLFFGPYVGQIPDPESRRESLKSTITQPQIIEDYEMPDDNEIVAIVDESANSPVLRRCESPKNRNASRGASRTGQQVERKPTPFVGNQDVEMTDASAAFVRPPSPKSRNCSRTRQAQYQDPALMAHDLAKEPQITGRPFAIKSPPHSASAVPDHYKQTSVENGFGPRTRHAMPRPKSMVW